jgi:hypothetical protein
VGSSPVLRTDPTGLLHPALLGCLIGAGAAGGGNLIINLLGGASLQDAMLNAMCDAAGGCIQGLLVGAGLGVLAGCMGGLLGSAVTTVCKYGVGLQGPPNWCNLVSAIVNTAFGCFAGAAGKVDDPAHKTEWLLTVLGFDEQAIGNLCPHLWPRGDKPILGGAGPMAGGPPLPRHDAIPVA